MEQTYPTEPPHEADDVATLKAAALLQPAPRVPPPRVPRIYAPGPGCTSLGGIRRRNFSLSPSPARDNADYMCERTALLAQAPAVLAASAALAQARPPPLPRPAEGDTDGKCEQAAAPRVATPQVATPQAIAPPADTPQAFIPQEATPQAATSQARAQPGVAAPTPLQLPGTEPAEAVRGSCALPAELAGAAEPPVRAPVPWPQAATKAAQLAVAAKLAAVHAAEAAQAAEAAHLKWLAADVAAGASRTEAPATAMGGAERHTAEAAVAAAVAFAVASPRESSSASCCSLAPCCPRATEASHAPNAANAADANAAGGVALGPSPLEMAFGRHALPVSLAAVGARDECGLQPGCVTQFSGAGDESTLTPGSVDHTRAESPSSSCQDRETSDICTRAASRGRGGPCTGEREPWRPGNGAGALPKVVRESSCGMRQDAALLGRPPSFEKEEEDDVIQAFMTSLLPKVGKIVTAQPSSAQHSLVCVHFLRPSGPQVSQVDRGVLSLSRGSMVVRPPPSSKQEVALLHGVVEMARPAPPEGSPRRGTMRRPMSGKTFTVRPVCGESIATADRARGADALPPRRGEVVAKTELAVLFARDAVAVAVGQSFGGSCAPSLRLMSREELGAPTLPPV